MGRVRTGSFNVVDETGREETGNGGPASTRRTPRRADPGVAKGVPLSVRPYVARQATQ